MDLGRSNRAPYCAVQRLLGYAVGRWADIEAGCIRAGVDLYGLSLRAGLNVIRSFYVEGLDPEQVDEFDAWLEMPPDAIAERADELARVEAEWGPL